MKKLTNRDKLILDKILRHGLISLGRIPNADRSWPEPKEVKPRHYYKIFPDEEYAEDNEIFGESLKCFEIDDSEDVEYIDFSREEKPKEARRVDKARERREIISDIEGDVIFLGVFALGAIITLAGLKSIFRTCKKLLEL